jgi:hypothetical protein
MIAASADLSKQHAGWWGGFTVMIMAIASWSAVWENMAGVVTACTDLLACCRNHCIGTCDEIQSVKQVNINAQSTIVADDVARTIINPLAR